MDRCIKTLCAWAFILGFLAGSAKAAEPSPNLGIQWHTDLQAAHRESVRLNRPVLIVFGAEWCHYCTKLEQECLGHPQIAQYVNQAFIPVHLDFDLSEREAKILDVKAIPCVVALTPQAELVGRLDGFAAPQKVADMLVGASQMQSKLQQARIMQASARGPMATLTR